MLGRVFLLTVGLASLAGLPARAEEGGALRTWKNSEGVAIRARMQGVEGQAVRLTLEDGKRTSYPLSRLSASDQEFVRAEGWPLPRPWRGWPEDLMVTLAEIQVDEKGRIDQWFTYHSEHFEIVAEEELATPAITHVARALEGVYQLLAESPWGVQAKPENGRFRTELYSSRDSYVENGGPPNTAGVYLVRKKVFLLPFQSIGLRSTLTGWKSSDEFSTKTLVHELTHMLMADVLGVLPPWLVEGAADYMSLMPMRTSTFRPRSLKKELLKHHEIMNTRVRGGKAAPLGPIFHVTLEDWQSGRLPGAPSAGSAGQLTQISGYYHAGLLLTYYFIHLDGRGDAARLQRFFSAAHHNRDKITKFQEEIDAYEVAWKEFAKRPDVREVSPGRFNFPDHLKAPKTPTFPFGNAKGEPQRFQEYEILFDGRTEKECLRDAAEALRELGLTVKQ